jgi:hypothetical protein
MDYIIPMRHERIGSRELKVMNECGNNFRMCQQDHCEF